MISVAQFDAYFWLSSSSTLKLAQLSIALQLNELNLVDTFE